ncbi:MAG TPA: hypothetical protein VF884_13885 [Nitrososphaeraceae archaeon]
MEAHSLQLKFASSGEDLLVYIKYLIYQLSLFSGTIQSVSTKEEVYQWAEDRIVKIVEREFLSLSFSCVGSALHV